MATIQLGVINDIGIIRIAPFTAVELKCLASAVNADNSAALADAATESANAAAATALSYVGTSPTGAYANLAALQAAYPTGEDGVFVVKDTGYWYFWNGSAWEDGGEYQKDIPTTTIEELRMSDLRQMSAIKEVENTLNSININQETTNTASGYGTISLPKNAANGGMSVKMEGLTEDVGGVITHFVPTGRVRSVDKNGLNPTALYLAAPELRSNGTVKDEIRKGANGYELVKRVGVGTLGSELIINGGFDTDTGWNKTSSWTISGGKATYDGTESTGRITSSVGIPMVSNKRYRVSLDVIGGDIECGLLSIGSSVLVTYPPAPDHALAIRGPGSHVFFIKSYDTTGVQLYALNTSTPNVSIDNFSIKEVSEVDGLSTLTNSFVQLSDGTILYTLDTPVIIPISYGGVLNSAENGTVYHEPIIADAGVYSTNMPILLTDYPIASIEEIIKHEGGVDTYLNASTAVIAPDGLSFTHPDLESGDLVLFTYSFDKESTNGNITATFYDSNVVKIDTATGTAYKIEDVVTNGVLTRTLTEV